MGCERNPQPQEKVGLSARGKIKGKWGCGKGSAGWIVYSCFWSPAARSLWSCCKGTVEIVKDALKSLEVLQKEMLDPPHFSSVRLRKGETALPLDPAGQDRAWPGCHNQCPFLWTDIEEWDTFTTGLSSRYHPGCKASLFLQSFQFLDPNPSDRRYHSG